MEQPEKKTGESNFAKFILLSVIIALILTMASLCLYRVTGTENLDQSLPKYVLQRD